MIRREVEIEPLAVNSRDAARLIGVSQRTIEELAKRGEIPNFQPGGRKRVFPVDGLRRWIAEQVEAAKPGEG